MRCGGIGFIFDNTTILTHGLCVGKLPSPLPRVDQLSRHGDLEIPRSPHTPRHPGPRHGPADVSSESLVPGDVPSTPAAALGEVTSSRAYFYILVIFTES